MQRSALVPIDYYADVPWPQTLEDRQRLAIELLRDAFAASAGRVLDVGCGDGLLLAEMDRRARLTERDWSVHGVDVSVPAIEAARRWPYSFQQANVEEALPYEDSSFDVVTAGEVIEHVYDPDHLLRECHRVLRPGGHLLVTTPNLQAWYNRALFALGIQPLFYETSTKSPAIGAGPIARLKRGTVPVGHLRIFNRRALVDLLQSEGFEPLTVRGAVFESLPEPVKRVDRLFSRWPALGSILVVLSRRD